MTHRAETFDSQFTINLIKGMPDSLPFLIFKMFSSGIHIAKRVFECLSNNLFPCPCPL